MNSLTVLPPIVVTLNHLALVMRSCVQCFLHSLWSPLTWRRRAAERRAAELDKWLFKLDGLSPAMLKDVGAPDHVIERASSQRWSAIDEAYWR